MKINSDNSGRLVKAQGHSFLETEKCEFDKQDPHPKWAEKTVTWFGVKHANMSMEPAATWVPAGCQLRPRIRLWGVLQPKRKWHTRIYSKRQLSSSTVIYRTSVSIALAPPAVLCEELFCNRWGTTFFLTHDIFDACLIMDKWLIDCKQAQPSEGDQAVTKQKFKRTIWMAAVCTVNFTTEKYYQSAQVKKRMFVTALAWVVKIHVY